MEDSSRRKKRSQSFVCNQHHHHHHHHQGTEVNEAPRVLVFPHPSLCCLDSWRKTKLDSYADSLEDICHRVSCFEIIIVEEARMLIKYIKILRFGMNIKANLKTLNPIGRERRQPVLQEIFQNYYRRFTMLKRRGTRPRKND